MSDEEIKVPFNIIMGSIQSEGIKDKGFCPFCNRDLNEKEYSNFETIMGRLRYLLKSREKGSKIAKDFLRAVFYEKQYLLERKNKEHWTKIPTDYPNWWVDLYNTIEKEKRGKEKKEKIGR